jgi:hypothetical protein
VTRKRCFGPRRMTEIGDWHPRTAFLAINSFRAVALSLQLPRDVRFGLDLYVRIEFPRPLAIGFRPSKEMASADLVHSARSASRGSTDDALRAGK